MLDWEYCWVLTLKHMRNMGTQAEACGYGLRETDNTKYIPPSIKPSYKTKSQPVGGRAVEKQVENIVVMVVVCWDIKKLLVALIKASTLT